jgi:hypothetical protein
MNAAEARSFRPLIRNSNAFLTGLHSDLRAVHWAFANTARNFSGWLPVTIGAALPPAALAIYLVVGHPDLPSRPPAEGNVVPPPSEKHAELKRRLDALAAGG